MFGKRLLPMLSFARPMHRSALDSLLEATSSQANSSVQRENPRSGKLPYFTVLAQAQAQADSGDRVDRESSSLRLIQDVLAQIDAKQDETPEDVENSTPSLFPAEVSEASFDYFVVIDFEATCDSTIFFPQEIIEFPAVLVEAKSLRVEDSFQTYVRPLYNPQLTDFCKKLTGIEQTQVDNGIPLALALERHDKWLEDRGVKEKRFGVITWTDWDCKTMLELECKLKGLTKPSYFNRWINLKSVFEGHYKAKGRLKQAVVHAGLIWEGREHCGLDDAKNTASLAIELMKQGVQLDYTKAPKEKEAFLPKIQKLLNAWSPSTDTELAKATRAEGLCFCGVKCKARLVTKPGPNQGKYFVSCGHWTITEGGKCTFFKWETAENIVP